MRAKTATMASGAALVLAATLFGGCIVNDQLTTVTIHPDGSADLVAFQSNVHSNEKGSKGDEELRQYVEQFNARKDQDHSRIASAGGDIRESRWIRNEAPYSNLIVARLPTAAALESYCTIKGDDGKPIVKGRFTQDGRRRKLSIDVTLPQYNEQPASTDRQSMANGLSETRFAVTKGTIVAARGFTIATDKQSALLAIDEVDDLLRTGRGRAEIHLEWELAEK